LIFFKKTTGARHNKLIFQTSEPIQFGGYPIKAAVTIQRKYASKKTA
jgi:hypothetical protein